jgi:hypothetical protein
LAADCGLLYVASCCFNAKDGQQAERDQAEAQARIRQQAEAKKDTLQ